MMVVDDFSTEMASYLLPLPSVPTPPLQRKGWRSLAREGPGEGTQGEEVEEGEKEGQREVVGRPRP